MLKTSLKPRICLVDYYLDGFYHHWEEIHGENFPVVGHEYTLSIDSGDDIEVVVLDIKPMSEVEYHVMLGSNQC